MISSGFPRKAVGYLTPPTACYSTVLRTLLHRQISLRPHPLPPSSNISVTALVSEGSVKLIFLSHVDLLLLVLGLLPELIHVRVLQVVLAGAPQVADREQHYKVEYVPEGVKDP